MCNSSEGWKNELLQESADDRSFFSNKRKWEREAWVVERFLSAMRVDFSVDELTEAPEPTDVKFRDSLFQIKEILEEDRRRGDEVKAHHHKLKNANNYTDLLEPYSHTTVAFAAVIDEVAKKARILAESKYSREKRGTMDLLFYFNKNLAIVPPTGDTLDDGYGFRSISVATNRYCSCLYLNSSTKGVLSALHGIVADCPMR